MEALGVLKLGEIEALIDALGVEGLAERLWLGVDGLRLILGEMLALGVLGEREIEREIEALPRLWLAEIEWEGLLLAEIDALIE